MLELKTTGERFVILIERVRIFGGSDRYTVIYDPARKENIAVSWILIGTSTYHIYRRVE